MKPSYLALVRSRGVAPVFLAATLGRMSFAMVTLGCIVLLASTTGSYAVAGASAGALGVANVLVAPWRARFVASRGQRLGLRVLALGYTLGACALAVAATAGAPSALLIVCAAATGGLAPPVGAAMRMRWRTLVDDESRLTRAYSLDAVSEELVFTLGPVLAGLLMATTVPQAGLLGSAILAAAGCFGMTRGADPPAGAAVAAPDYFQLRIFRFPGFTSAILITAATGVVIGGIDVIIPAQTAPNDALAGLLLGAVAFGSGVGGLVYGARDWTAPLRPRLIAFAAAMAGACGLLALAPVGVILAVGLSLTGLALAPAMVTGYLLVDQITDEADRLEAHTWINTAVNVGSAAASALGGFALEKLAIPHVFTAAALLAALLVASGTILGRSRPGR